MNKLCSCCGQVVNKENGIYNGDMEFIDHGFKLQMYTCSKNKCGSTITFLVIENESLYAQYKNRIELRKSTKRQLSQNTTDQ